MKREILFRGKRLDNGEWVYGIPLFDWADCSLKCRDQHNGELLTFFVWNDQCHEYEEFEVDPATVGQYTGLTDKNGVKIFEGNILKDIETGRLYTVVWQKNAFILADKNGLFFSVFDLDILEIVGNIHDNPELLEVEPC